MAAIMRTLIDLSDAIGADRFKFLFWRTLNNLLWSMSGISPISLPVTQVGAGVGTWCGAKEFGFEQSFLDGVNVVADKGFVTAHL